MGGGGGEYVNETEIEVFQFDLTGAHEVKKTQKSYDMTSVNNHTELMLY